MLSNYWEYNIGDSIIRMKLESIKYKFDKKYSNKDMSSENKNYESENSHNNINKNNNLNSDNFNIKKNIKKINMKSTRNHNDMIYMRVEKMHEILRNREKKNNSESEEKKSKDKNKPNSAKKIDDELEDLINYYLKCEKYFLITSHDFTKKSVTLYNNILKNGTKEEKETIKFFTDFVVKKKEPIRKVIIDNLKALTKLPNKKEFQSYWKQLKKNEDFYKKNMDDLKKNSEMHNEIEEEEDIEEENDQKKDKNKNNLKKK